MCFENCTLKFDKYGNDKYHSDHSSKEGVGRFHTESADSERRASKQNARKILSNANIKKLMDSIEKTFSDKGGNHLLVALYFYAIIGPEGYQSYGRAFYHEKQSPIIHLISSYLKDKQEEYNE